MRPYSLDDIDEDGDDDDGFYEDEEGDDDEDDEDDEDEEEETWQVSDSIQFSLLAGRHHLYSRRRPTPGAVARRQRLATAQGCRLAPTRPSTLLRTTLSVSKGRHKPHVGDPGASLGPSAHR